jgi:hypothetical protein
VCTWDGDHGSFEITPYEAAWWFTQVVDQYDANPQLYHEDFPAGVPTFSWNLNADTEVGFNVEYLATGHLHMGVPKESGYVYNGSEWMYVNNGRAEAQLAADYWDMPTPYDFSVGVTVTNLRYNFPEARLTVSKGEQSIEIRTFFKQKILGSPQLRAQVYVDGTPRDASWVIDRPGISRLAGGACWLLRADPITDMVTVSQRSIGTWPNCTGSWNDVVSFANPFAGLDMYDNANYPLNVSLSAWRNSVTTASADGYIRFGDVYFSRTSLGPGLP